MCLIPSCPAFLAFLFLVMLSFSQALSYDDPPACLRPPLATANALEQTDKRIGHSGTSSMTTKATTKTQQRRKRKDSAKKNAEEEILILEVNSLRDFLDSLGFLADPTPIYELGRVEPIIAPVSAHAGSIRTFVSHGSASTPVFVISTTTATNFTPSTIPPLRADGCGSWKRRRSSAV
ncbi:hypothetical protein BJ742DRAFT_898148 [Cladochytrium replicatum]|nr:hypothetical protein BJ742DRAFT_898148 [Cladochytrium replicatum]